MCVPCLQLVLQQSEVHGLQDSHAQAEADIEALKKDISRREEALRQLMSALHGLAAKVMGMLLGCCEGLVCNCVFCNVCRCVGPWEARGAGRESLPSCNSMPTAWMSRSAPCCTRLSSSGRSGQRVRQPFVSGSLG